MITINFQIPIYFYWILKRSTFWLTIKSCRNVVTLLTNAVIHCVNNEQNVQSIYGFPHTPAQTWPSRLVAQSLTCTTFSTVVPQLTHKLVFYLIETVFNSSTHLTVDTLSEPINFNSNCRRCRQRIRKVNVNYGLSPKSMSSVTHLALPLWAKSTDCTLISCSEILRLSIKSINRSLTQTVIDTPLQWFTVDLVWDNSVMQSSIFQIRCTF